jgi:hypothetical protein
MLGENLTRHVLGDLLIILKLARVACEECRSYVADAGFALAFKKLPDHDRLVDVRHPHPFLDEISEMPEGRHSSPSGVEERTAMLPPAALDCCFKFIGCCSIRQHHEAVAKVLVDVPAHECIHLVTA